MLSKKAIKNITVLSTLPALALAFVLIGTPAAHAQSWDNGYSYNNYRDNDDTTAYNRSFTNRDADDTNRVFINRDNDDANRTFVNRDVDDTRMLNTFNNGFMNRDMDDFGIRNFNFNRFPFSMLNRGEY